jgi:hypothetical protein
MNRYSNKSNAQNQLPPRDKTHSVISEIESRKSSLPSLKAFKSKSKLSNLSKISSDDRVSMLKRKITEMGFGKTEVGKQPNIVIKNKITKMSVPMVNISRGNNYSERNYQLSNLSR